MAVSLIVACTKNRVIGLNNRLPWKLPSDMQRFKKLTQGKVVLMGRRTFESMGSKPLPNRSNVVVTKSTQVADQYVYGQPSLMVVTTLVSGLHLAATLAASIEARTGKSELSEIMVIGGESIYRDCLPLANKVYLTTLEIDLEVLPGNPAAYFPELNMNEWDITSQEQSLDEKGLLEGVPGQIALPNTYRVLERKKPT